MKASELNVDDLFLLDNKPIRIDGYDRGCVCFDGGYECNLCELKPIPLTEEILKANGFEYKCATMQTFAEERVFSYENSDEQFIIELEECTSEYTTFNGTNGLEDYFCANILCGIFCINSIPFKYVHELQHALRLCGLNELADNLKIE